jgi:tripartite motif-containing protein 71
MQFRISTLAAPLAALAIFSATCGQAQAGYQLIRAFGTGGSENGQFSSPSGVAVDASGNVFVADSSNYRIQEFNSSGAYVSQFGTLGNGHGQFLGPSGIAVDSSNNLWVGDGSDGNPIDRIEEFSNSGAYISQFGTKGSANGQLRFPTGVAVDSSNNIWVADHDNHRIQEFSSSGVYISQFGTLGSGNGQFSFPSGVAVDALNHVWVVDNANNRIQEFSDAGAYITQFGTHGTGNGQLLAPWGNRSRSCRQCLGHRYW